MALAMAPIYISEALLSLPLVQALLRLQKPLKAHYDTAFTLSALRGFLLTAGLGLLALPVSSFYQKPELAPLIMVLAFAPAFRGLISPRMEIFMRQMDFRREFLLEIFGKLAAIAVAIAIVLSTGSYWAIAAATLVKPIASCLLSYIIAPYRPRLSLAKWRDFADIIGWNSISQILSATNWQATRLVLGRSVPLVELGQYSMSEDLVAISTNSLIFPLERPIMAGYAQQSDHNGRVAYFLRTQSTVLTFLTPIFLAISMLAAPIIYVVLGTKWLDAAFILQCLAAIALLTIPIVPLSPLVLFIGQTKFNALRNFAEFIVKIPALVFGVSYYGIEGGIMAIFLGALVSFLVSLLVSKKLTYLSIWQQLQPMVRPALAGLGMAGIMFAAKDLISITDSPAKLIVFLKGIAVGVMGLSGYSIILMGLHHLQGRPEGVETRALEIIRAKLQPLK